MTSNGGMVVSSTKTSETNAAYVYRGQNLWIKAASDLGISSSGLTPADFLSWLEDKLPQLKPASRRQYLAASREWLAYLKQTNPQHGGTSGDLAEAIRRCLTMKSANYTPAIKQQQKRGNTSSQKAKKISPAEIQKLAINQADLKGKWIKPAVIWMAANVLLGLRPIEWRTARLIETKGQLMLVVNNAKNTNGRSHGKLRHLNLSHLPEKDIQLIQGQLQAVSYFVVGDASWSTYYEGVRKAIRRLTRANLTRQRKYPSLYSSRHQFAANAKYGGLTKPEIAALMGHAVDDTASMHYGKRKHGNGSFLVKATPAEISRVRVKPIGKSTQLNWRASI